MDWEPQQEDIEWTKNVLDNLEVNQDWMEGEMAFRRTGENTLTLLTRTERAADSIERVGIVLKELDWVLEDKDAKIIPDDPMAAAEMMQKEASSWTCPACNDERVVNMDLERVKWQVAGNHIHINDAGEGEEQDRWVVGVTCNCGEELYLSPDDYYLVAGEINFYTWFFTDEEGVEWFARVMPPENIVECLDGGILEQVNASHLGTTFQGSVVPPHMRGTFCMFVTGASLEEE